MEISSLVEVRRFYEQCADDYNAMMDGEIELPLYAETLGGLAARIAKLDGPVLDTSCGSGHMLAKLRDIYAPGRELLGVDLSPRMVAISRNRLGDAASTVEGDMSQLEHVKTGTCAAVLSFFALHHVDFDGMRAAFAEWHRALQPGGQLLVATWEGDGVLDYGEHSDVIALRTRDATVSGAASAAGFRVDRCEVKPVDGMSMDAVYLTATR